MARLPGAAKVRALLLRAALLTAGNILVIALLLILVEGAASWMFALHQKAPAQSVAERLHTKYDAQLGWVSLPNVRRTAMYGPGLPLTTNSRGFRGTLEFALQVPTNKTRAICSGDSFTLGYGVGDNDTWCHLLSSFDPNLETVNMGQGGYGFDQAYLWYLRDGQELQHQLHIFAFITEDLHRMTRKTFMGYSKPILSLQNGRLVVQNTPVPSSSSHRLTRYLPVVRSLRMLTVANAANQRLRRGAAPAQATTFESLHVLLPVVLADLQRRNQQRDSRLVMVYLPTDYELHSPGPDKWAAFFQQQADALGFTFINLFEPFRKLPPDSVASLYLQPKDLQFQGAEGHFNRAGNAYVAALLYEKLLNTKPRTGHQATKHTSGLRPPQFEHQATRDTSGLRPPQYN